jgi:hypothetical protein
MNLYRLFSLSLDPDLNPDTSRKRTGD